MGQKTAKDLDFAKIDEQLIDQAIAVLEALQEQGLKAVTAKSCTGGLIAAVLSEAPGAAEHLKVASLSTRPSKSFRPISRSPCRYV